MQNKKYHIPFIVNLIILVIIISIIYLIWHCTTGYKLAVIIEKPNQEYIVVEKDELTNLPYKVGIGHSHHDALNNIIDLSEVYDGLYSFILELFHTKNNANITTNSNYKIEWVTPDGVVEHSEIVE